MNVACGRTLVIAVFVAAAAAGCGKSATSPDSPTTSAQSALPSSQTGATISGTVLGVSEMSSLSAFATTLTVSVVGSTATTAVDGNGRFELRGVAPGKIELRFRSADVDARLQLGDVADRQTIVITVRVSGSTAQLENGNQGPPPAPPGTTAVQVEGTVTAISATGFTVAGRTVVVNSATKIEDGERTVALSAISVGDRVEVKGTVTGTSNVITATKVEIERPDANDGDDDDEDEDENETELTGTISALTGSCAANTLGFTVSSTLVNERGDAIQRCRVQRPEGGRRGEGQRRARGGPQRAGGTRREKEIAATRPRRA